MTSDLAEIEARRLGLDLAHRSPLGRRLLELRAQAIATGEPLLTTWEELDAEIAERRGGYSQPAQAGFVTDNPARLMRFTNYTPTRW